MCHTTDNGIVKKEDAMQTSLLQNDHPSGWQLVAASGELAALFKRSAPIESQSLNSLAVGVIDRVHHGRLHVGADRAADGRRRGRVAGEQRLPDVGLFAVVVGLVALVAGGRREAERSIKDNFAKRLAKVVGARRVQERVDARVHVGEDVRRDLDHHQHRRDVVHGQALEDEHQLDGAPAHGEDDHHDDHHASDALLAPPALRGHSSAGRHSAPQPHQHAQVQAANQQERYHVRRGEERDLKRRLAPTVLVREERQEKIVILRAPLATRKLRHSRPHLAVRGK